MRDDLVNARQLGEWLGVSDRSVRDLVSAGVVERVDRGRYPLRASIRRAFAHLRETAAGRASAGPLDPQQEKARLDSARADLAELALREKSGELVPAGDQDAALIALATAIRARLLALPAQVAPKVATVSRPAVAQKIIAEAVTEALHDLAETGRIVSARAAAEREATDTNE